MKKGRKGRQERALERHRSHLKNLNQLRENHLSVSKASRSQWGAYTDAWQMKLNRLDFDIQQVTEVILNTERNLRPHEVR